MVRDRRGLTLLNAICSPPPIESDFHYSFAAVTQARNMGGSTVVSCRHRASFWAHVVAIIEYGEMSSMMGLPCNTWVMRELLPVTPLFTAFHRMPITKERRYFIENGEVICHHPYWPTEAIQSADIPNWEEILTESNRESDEEVRLLSQQSRQASMHFDGAWSLDWLFTERGWIAIDMAHANESFHWPNCRLSSVLERAEVR